MSDLLADTAEKLEPIEATFEGCDDADVRAVEAKAGFKLPESYASFLKTFGRCMFARAATIRCSAPIPPPSIATMFGCKDSAGSILTDMRLHPEYLRNGLVPIADDNFNNRYVLRKTGEILFIDYSRGAGVVSKVADSFDEFLSMLDVRTLS
jgi:hypothetical protein